ncbi:MAG: dTDP-4-dehydrorhamnose 3,5-epimerase [Blastocatellia bacterium]
MPPRFCPSRIPDVVLLEPQVFRDDRGLFLETYQQEKFAALGLTAAFVQDNHSGSYQGVLRGLHYQIRQPQGKLVRVISGEIYDVAVDLRRASVTFGQWVGTVLSAQNCSQLWIPPGFAHGFYVLSKWAEVLYKTTDYYSPQWERTLLWNDPQLAILWPLLPHQPLLISPKDAEGTPLREAELFD